jgi:hypothetical protein
MEFFSPFQALSVAFE